MIHNVKEISKHPWIELVESTILENLDKQDFDNKVLARLLGTSERQLYRKIKTLKGMSPNYIIREIRMHKAIELLENEKELSISDIAYQIGFESPGYFSIVFKKRFGKSPRELKRESIY